MSFDKIMCIATHHVVIRALEKSQLGVYIDVSQPELCMKQ